MRTRCKAQEKIFDVVWAGNRKPGKDGKLPPVGDAKATWTNTIVAPELSTVWKDPEFRADQRAQTPGSQDRVLVVRGRTVAAAPGNIAA